MENQENPSTECNTNAAFQIAPHLKERDPCASHYTSREKSSIFGCAIQGCITANTHPTFSQHRKWHSNISESVSLLETRFLSNDAAEFVDKDSCSEQGQCSFNSLEKLSFQPPPSLEILENSPSSQSRWVRHTSLPTKFSTKCQQRSEKRSLPCSGSYHFTANEHHSPSKLARSFLSQLLPLSDSFEHLKGPASMDHQPASSSSSCDWPSNDDKSIPTVYHGHQSHDLKNAHLPQQISLYCNEQSAAPAISHKQTHSKQNRENEIRLMPNTTTSKTSSVDSDEIASNSAEATIEENGTSSDENSLSLSYQQHSGHILQHNSHLKTIGPQSLSFSNSPPRPADSKSRLSTAPVSDKEDLSLLHLQNTFHTGHENTTNLSTQIGLFQNIECEVDTTVHSSKYLKHFDLHQPIRSTVAATYPEPLNHSQNIEDVLQTYCDHSYATYSLQDTYEGPNMADSENLMIADDVDLGAVSMPSFSQQFFSQSVSFDPASQNFDIDLITQHLQTQSTNDCDISIASRLCPKPKIVDFIASLRISEKHIQGVDHSVKFSDEVFEHRFVVLPRNHPFLNFEWDDQSRNYCLTEAEWRSLGIRQTRGWQHVGYSFHEAHILLFRRPIGTDPRTGAVCEKARLYAQRRIEAMSHWIAKKSTRTREQMNAGNQTLPVFGSTNDYTSADFINRTNEPTTVTSQQIFHKHLSQSFELISQTMGSFAQHIDQLPYFEIYDKKNGCVSSFQPSPSLQIKPSAVCQSNDVEHNYTEAQEEILNKIRLLYAAIYLPLYAK